MNIGFQRISLKMNENWLLLFRLYRCTVLLRCYSRTNSEKVEWYRSVMFRLNRTRDGGMSISSGRLDNFLSPSFSLMEGKTLSIHSFHLIFIPRKSTLCYLTVTTAHVFWSSPSGERVQRNFSLRQNRYLNGSTGKKNSLQSLFRVLHVDSRKFFVIDYKYFSQRRTTSIIYFIHRHHIRKEQKS